MAKKTALITGATSGIGYELAKLHAQDHFNLVLVARNASRLMEVKKELENTYGIEAYTFPCDLSKPEELKKLTDFTDKQLFRIDHLVNNAGIGVFGKLWETDIDQHLKLIQLNVNALVSLTHFYSEKMVKHGSGNILNVASTAAFMPGPFMSTYFASKAFVLSFGEAVHSELTGSGVSLTTLCPGPTETNFESAATGMKKSGLFTKSKVASPTEVAKDGYKAMNTGSSLVISGWVNKFNAFSIRLSPRKMVTAITKSIMKPMD